MLARRRPPPRRGPFGPLYSDAALQAIREVAAAARKEGIPVALVGGLALRVHGSSRLTDDVDLAAAALPAFAATGIPFPFGGTRFWTRRGVEVNLIVRSDEAAPLYEDAVVRAEKTRWGFPIASPEHLVAMKLEAGRDVDRLDLDFLLGTRGLVDRRRARRIVRRFLGAPALRSLDAVCRGLRRKP